METISLVHTPDGHKEILYGKTKVVNINCPEGTIKKVKDMSIEKVNKILETYFPEEGEGLCVVTPDVFN